MLWPSFCDNFCTLATDRKPRQTGSRCRPTTVACAQFRPHHRDRNEAIAVAGFDRLESGCRRAGSEDRRRDLSVLELLEGVGGPQIDFLDGDFQGTENVMSRHFGARIRL